MKYELVDVVDENDNVTSTIERTPAWDKNRPTIYRVVNVFVFTSEGKLLLQQRAKTKKFEPLLFDTSVCGLVTSGLSYEEAAIKEAKEELGLTQNLNFLTAFTEMKGHKVVCHGHLFEAVFDGPYTNWQAEAERLEFMTLEEVEGMVERFPYLFTTCFIEALKQYKKAKEAK